MIFTTIHNQHSLKNLPFQKPQSATGNRVNVNPIFAICNLYDVSADYLLGRRIDDRALRKRRFDALTEDNQRFIIKLENLLLLDQQRQTKK